VTTRDLAGFRVVTTRERSGRLDEILLGLGAEVVHVPLISIEEPIDGGRDRDRVLSTLDDAGWLVVTSQHGARRAGSYAAKHPELRMAAVGTRTAMVLAQLAGRPVDLVPGRQTADDLIRCFPPPSSDRQRIVVAQADRAEPTLAAGLVEMGYDVVTVTAYRTSLRRPPAGQHAMALDADALTLASGSAARGWWGAFGAEAPPIVVAIGPTTARVAREIGLEITHVAADHDAEGLAREVTAALTATP